MPVQNYRGLRHSRSFESCDVTAFCMMQFHYTILVVAGSIAGGSVRVAQGDARQRKNTL